MQTVIRRLTLAASVAAMAGHATSAAAQGARVDPAKIDEIFAFANAKSPGCAVATVRDGRIEFARGYGMADIARGIQITTKTPMDLASVTKQFTGAAVNLLVADGKLSLDDDVRKYLPELPRYDAPMTIGQLLNHTSGVRDHTALATLADVGEDGLANADALAILARQRRTDFTPGAQWAYSNGGYFLLSMIVERVSGKALPAFAEERLFRPLGMAATVFRVRNDMPKGRALGYVEEKGKWKARDAQWGAVGDGGLFSTVEDMVIWQRHMESSQLGGAKWRELTDARGTLTDGTPILYGAGLMHGTFAGQPTIEHGGASGATTSFVLRFPGLHLSIVMLCQRPFGGGPYVSRPTYVRVGTARRDLKDYKGTYVSSDLDRRWKVQVADTALILDRPSGSSYWLYRAFEDAFESPSYGMLVRFFRDEAGEVTTMELNAGPRVWHLRFERER